MTKTRLDQKGLSCNQIVEKDMDIIIGEWGTMAVCLDQFINSDFSDDIKMGEYKFYDNEKYFLNGLYYEKIIIKLIQYDKEYEFGGYKDSKNQRLYIDLSDRIGERIYSEKDLATIKKALLNSFVVDKEEGNMVVGNGYEFLRGSFLDGNDNRIDQWCRDGVNACNTTRQYLRGEVDIKGLFDYMQIGSFHFVYNKPVAIDENLLLEDTSLDFFSKTGICKYYDYELERIVKDIMTEFTKVSDYEIFENISTNEIRVEYPTETTKTYFKWIDLVKPLMEVIICKVGEEIQDHNKSFLSYDTMMELIYVYEYVLQREFAISMFVNSNNRSALRSVASFIENKGEII